MEKKIKKLGSAKRFGSRYGAKAKHKLATIEKIQRKKQKCPYCSRRKVKKISFGIWFCNHCQTKFTGKAYSVKEKIFKEEKAISEKEELEGEPEKEKEENKEDNIKNKIKVTEEDEE